jgi:hypothetical protein
MKAGTGRIEWKRRQRGKYEERRESKGRKIQRTRFNKT